MTGNRTIKSQIIGGLWLTAKTLLAIFTAVGLVGGVAVIRMPYRSHPDSLFGQHPFIPWVCVLASTAVLIVTMDRWIRILPGILAYGTLGGVIMFATGRYERVHVSRLLALALTLFLIATSALTSSFVGRRLHLLDRTVLLGFLFCLAFSVTPNFPAMAKALAIGLFLLLVAWTVNRFERHIGDGRVAH